MLFNSLIFIVFFTAVFGIYWFVLNRSPRWQNAFILLASYVFYGWWDYRFLLLLFFSTFLDFFTGLRMHEANSAQGKKFWFWLSIIVNLGFLAFFKYYNFFVESFAELLASVGFQVNVWTLWVILPVGISFYTFHGMSYVIDIYYDRIKPTGNFIDYAVFVSFFPLLVAGPIERARNLLPQFAVARTFSYEQGVNGLVLIFWGLFKKIVIADNCATLVNTIFDDYTVASGMELVSGAVLFAFQIYGDFSGYSDIAIGTAMLLGIRLMVNFRVPYFSRNIAEFWRRWHISLTSWFRDYLYIPLGGSRGSKFVAIRNTFVVFTVSGLWHGANWTFVFWGLLNAVYFLPLLLTDKNRDFLDNAGEKGNYPSIKELLQMGLTFLLVCLAWIVFRSLTIQDALQYVYRMFTTDFLAGDFPHVPEGVFLVPLMIAIEWVTRKDHIPFVASNEKFKWFFIVSLIALTIVFRYFGKSIEFIYFQF